MAFCVSGGFRRFPFAKPAESSALITQGARASLSAFDVATAEHTQGRHVADADEFCCRFERNFAALRPTQGSIVSSSTIVDLY